MASSKAPPFTLYEYRASPFCVAIRIALAECGVTFTPREVDPIKDRTAAFLRRSPFGRLPALVEHRPSGELSVFESPAILHFLAERFEKSPLSFSDLSSKAQALSWLSFLSSGLGDLLWSVLTEAHLYEGSDTRSQMMRAFMEELERQLDVLDKHLARRAYLAGDYSIADTLATPLLDLLDQLKEIELVAYPHVLSWRERLRGRPSYKHAWPSA
ncbi:MAG: glutathione S-transferase family protein [Myxococcaceae bacterium]|nr:glutathione S-transferase family protein [Myxococcaceae bacterium]MBH2006497.1 glutathione S-transferase family protein [Myxococcaceae bacterium]